MLEAESSFDGITYGKGAASLQQLHHFLGDKDFQKGVVQYFKTYAWTNTERKDFVGRLAQASGKDLGDWQRLWLTTANLNTLSADFSCSNGKLDHFIIKQTAPTAFPTIRPHAFSIAFLVHKNNKLVVQNEIKAVVNGPKTEISSAIGRPCPEVVYPNFHDYGYFEIALDKKSLKVLLNDVSSIQDSFLRKMVWTSLWDMTKNAELSFLDYGSMAAKALNLEKEETIIGTLLQQITGGRWGGQSMYAYAQFAYDDALENPRFAKISSELEKTTWERLHRDPGALKKQWFDGFVGASLSRAADARLLSILDKKTSIPKLKIDQDMRWSIIRHLAVHGVPGISDRIESEAKNDPSFSGKLWKISSEAGLPVWSEKEKWIAEFNKPKSTLAFAELRSVLGSLFPPMQKELHKQYGSKFFADLLAATKNKDSEELRTFTFLAPYSCKKEDSLAIDSFLQKNGGLDPGVIKSLRQSSDLNARCERVLEVSNTEKFEK